MMQWFTRGSKTAFYGMILGLALILAYVESLIPMPIPVPGVKLGLANSVILFVLYRDGTGKAMEISLFRIILTGLLFGNMAGILYSLAGAACSLTVMSLLKKTGRFEITGVSVAGGVAHNAGQLLMAAFIVETAAIYYYMPVLILAGTMTGVLIGFIAGAIHKRVPDNINYDGGKER